MVPMAGGLVKLLGIHIETPHCRAVGERIGDISKSDQFEGVSIVAFIRKGRCFVPDEHDRIEVGDDVYVITKAKRVADVMAGFGHQEREGNKLVIVGAGQ